MAHFTIDYAPALDGPVDIAALCNVVRLAAIETGVFPLPGIRVRATPAAYCSIADGDAQHGYIDISVRLRGGRSTADKERATEIIFSRVHETLRAAIARQSIALSLEMRDIDPTLSPKAGSIRTFLKETS